MELVQKEFDTRTLIKNIIVQTKPLADKKELKFKYEISSDIPKTLFGDETKIREVLINLLNNAVKYTLQGSVQLNVSCKKINDGQTSIVASVSDTGIGIKEENQGMIFNAFEQVNQKVHSGIEGTGLGLSIVKGYVQLMGGDISLESEYGEGTTITVEMPQVIVDDSPIGDISVDEASTESKISDIQFEGLNVLVVDDNNINLAVIKKTLKHYGIAAKTVNSGAASIKKCQDELFDIVFMDQMMPGMDGVEAMNHIRDISEHYSFGGTCKIIALTANAIFGVREELMSLGFDEYLSKPIEFEALEEILSQIAK